MEAHRTRLWVRLLAVAVLTAAAGTLIGCARMHARDAVPADVARAIRPRRGVRRLAGAHTAPPHRPHHPRRDHRGQPCPGLLGPLRAARGHSLRRAGLRRGGARRGVRPGARGPARRQGPDHHRRGAGRDPRPRRAARPGRVCQRHHGARPPGRDLGHDHRGRPGHLGRRHLQPGRPDPGRPGGAGQRGGDPRRRHIQPDGRHPPPVAQPRDRQRRAARRRDIQRRHHHRHRQHGRRQLGHSRQGRRPAQQPGRRGRPVEHLHQRQLVAGSAAAAYTPAAS